MKKIECTPNGPYKLEFSKDLQTPQGPVQVKSPAFLCRCGESSNKPFCDGSHAKVGFSDKKESDRTEDRLDEYKNDEIAVTDNRGICAHAGYCTNQHPKTFRHKDDGSFVDPDADNKEDVQKTINQCPSGALNYSTKDSSSKDVSQNADPSIFVAPNGPYALKNVDLQNTEWLKGADKNRLALCRCGKSNNKPFCSGAHWYHHFDEKTEASEWAKTQSGPVSKNEISVLSWSCHLVVSDFIQFM